MENITAKTEFSELSRDEAIKKCEELQKELSSWIESYGKISDRFDRYRNLINNATLLLG